MCANTSPAITMTRAAADETSLSHSYVQMGELLGQLCVFQHINVLGKVRALGFLYLLLARSYRKCRVTPLNSASKTFTAAATLAAITQGKLSLSTPGAHSPSRARSPAQPKQQTSEQFIPCPALFFHMCPIALPQLTITTLYRYFATVASVLGADWCPGNVPSSVQRYPGATLPMTRAAFLLKPRPCFECLAVPSAF